MSSSAISAQKKRALDALSRRFAAEAHQQSNLTTPAKPIPNPKSKIFSEPKTVRTPLVTRQVGLSSSVLRPETPKPADTDVHPIYHEIFGGLDDNLVPVTGQKDLSRQDVVSSIVNDIVSKGEEGNKFGKGGKRLKVDNFILLDNFVPKDDSLLNARLKAIKSQSKRSRLHMSKRQHRKCGSFDLPKEFHNFDLFKPMHESWKVYIVELLKERGKKKLTECLLSADLHGSFVLVMECKTVAFNGISGILIRETAETLGIITQDNLFRVVPKIGSVFMFQADCWKITLYGEKISERMLNQKSTRQQK